MSDRYHKLIINDIEVSGLLPAFRAMASKYGEGCDPTSDSDYDEWDDYVYMGSKDLALADKIAKGEIGDTGYRKMIVVYLDIVAPSFMWEQLEPYESEFISIACKYRQNTVYSNPYYFTKIIMMNYDILSKIYRDHEENTSTCWEEFRLLCEDLPYFDVIAGVKFDIEEEEEN